MSTRREQQREYHDRLRTGHRPIGDIDRAVAQAVADGANGLDDVARISGLGRDTAYRALLNLKGKGIVLPPLTERLRGGLTIAPNYVVHKNQIFELRRIP